jgi:hypothetical protein
MLLISSCIMYGSYVRGSNIYKMLSVNLFVKSFPRKPENILEWWFDVCDLDFHIAGILKLANI